MHMTPANVLRSSSSTRENRSVGVVTRATSSDVGSCVVEMSETHTVSDARKSKKASKKHKKSQPKTHDQDLQRTRDELRGIGYQFGQYGTSISPYGLGHTD
jgi:hypothetical protein